MSGVKGKARCDLVLCVRRMIKETHSSATSHAQGIQALEAPHFTCSKMYPSLRPHSCLPPPPRMQMFRNPAAWVMVINGFPHYLCFSKILGFSPAMFHRALWYILMLKLCLCIWDFFHWRWKYKNSKQLYPFSLSNAKAWHLPAYWFSS